MNPRVKHVLVITTATILLATAGWALAQDCPTEPTVQNFTGGGSTACPCFAMDEEAGAVFPVPVEHFPIEVLKVGVGWGSVFGGSPSQTERAIYIYNGQLPDPGTPVFSLPGPVMVDGVINEFNIEPVGPVIIPAAPVAATLQFFIPNANNIYAPTVVHDGNGCTGGMNLINAIPGGWMDACAAGITGDWIFHLVYRQVNCLSDVGDDIHTVSNVPLKAQLNDCYPNPFNPQTLISFDMPAAGSARLEIYALDGKRVATLVDGEVGAGRHEEVWYGRDDAGRMVPSGVYFYRFQTKDFSDSKRMVLLK
ncbi:MAG: T9SS type A sorting domain-containing protein [Candidatus Krumholzibacteriota bacterium]